MAVTYSATPFGTAGRSLKSKVTNSVASTAGPTSIEVITVVHGLPTTPDLAYAVTRSVIATPSGGGAHWTFVEANASVAVFHLQANDGGAVRAAADFICERYNSLEMGA